MTTALKTLRLHFVSTKSLVLTPLLMLLGIILIAIVVALSVFGNFAEDPALYESFARNNQGALWAVTGYMATLGVQSVATTFPLAIALGADRAGFALGTFLRHILVAAGLALVVGLLLLLEQATGHWFVNAYAFDVYLLGSGDLWTAMMIAFLAFWAFQALGGVFGAAWLRFGSKGPVLLGGALFLVAFALTVVAFVQGPSGFLAQFRWWWLIPVAIVVALLSALGQYVLLRRATNR